MCAMRRFPRIKFEWTNLVPDWTSPVKTTIPLFADLTADLLIPDVWSVCNVNVSV